MECLEAQRLISEQLDREPVDAALLEEAKNHCRTCEECGGYIRTLVALRQHPLPEPPADLPERVMEAVAAAAAADAAVRAGAVTSATEGAGVAASAESPAAEDEPSIERLMENVRDRRNRRTIIAWASAAALVFLVAGIGAVAGLRTILTPPTTSQTANYGSAAQLESANPAAGVAAEAPAAADQAAKAPAPQTAAPGYIVVNGVVYKEAGEATGVDQTTLKVVGSTTSSLGGTSVATHDVLGLDDPSKAYVVDDDGTLLGFTRITRTFGGKEYVYASAGTVTRYGDWPVLPAGVKTPSNPDGTPEYVSAGTDSAGVTVYRPVGSAGAEGIAVAPGTSSTDPAAGNPNWTWWQLVR